MHFSGKGRLGLFIALIRTSCVHWLGEQQLFYFILQ